MALIDIKLFSVTLQTQTDIRVILPTPDANWKGPCYDTGKRYQVLYLLHGFSGDCTVWTRYSNIERYAQQHRLAVVCASVGNSFYADMVHGGRYMTFMLEELPAFIRHAFPVSHRREDTFIAGISMGGFGAFRLALDRPELFSQAVSMSGAVDIIAMSKMFGGDPAMGFGDIFTPEALLPGGKNDLPALAESLQNAGTPLPRLYQCCGTEDFLYQLNLGVRNRFQALGVDYTYDESAGMHDWDYWDGQIRKVLQWLPLAGDLVDG